MSSQRSAPSPVTLDSRTFGGSPAAIYLAELLNQKNDPVLARKTAKILAEGRELIADLARAHLDYDALSTRTLARILPLVSAYNQAHATEPLRATDPHIANLATNVLEGTLKVWKRRVQEARRKEKSLAKNQAPGTSVQWLPAHPLPDETSNALLQARSKRHLANAGKVDTV